jgi:hypothetical protein
MARYKPIDRSPKLIPVDYSRQILLGSFEYALCYLIDHEMELSEFDPRFRNDEGGASAYAPALLLKIVLLAYSRGLVSSRAMESACRHNVLWMAVCGGATPHFTTLAACVRTGGEAIGRLFTQVLLGVSARVCSAGSCLRSTGSSCPAMLLRPEAVRARSSSAKPRRWTARYAGCWRGIARRISLRRVSLPRSAGLCGTEVYWLQDRVWAL